MLAIQSHCHNGNIQLAQEGIPADADVIVLFLSNQVAASHPTATPSTANNFLQGLSPEQRAALVMQSQTGFAQAVLLDPAEDCWDTI
ncbi:MAG: hypothetical protein QM533_06085 [Cytophagales bacterium]|nr:hypothetical protein [Cytophagales bacterium]